MRRYKCEYHDGLFSVKEVDKHDNISSFDHEIWADTITEAVKEFMAYEGI